MPFFSKPNILDDRSNPLLNWVRGSQKKGLEKGNSETINGNGERSPKGFTPPQDFYTSPGEKDGYGEVPAEYGNRIRPNGDETLMIPDESVDRKTRVLDLFQDFGQKKFLHLLDYFETSDNKFPGDRRTIRSGGVGGNNGDKTSVDIDTSQIYLGSFIKTTMDNEDPTILGFDIMINVLESPLFNGEIDKFIEIFGANNTEIASRKPILDNFRNQLFKFLKVDIPSQRTSFTGIGDGTKVYYLKSLTGLDKLTESISSEQGSKAFVDYGVDMISMEFREDVTQNMGYLASLYKTLAWSRLNGKQVIPENLLRFNCEITVSEVRNYVRVFKIPKPTPPPPTEPGEDGNAKALMTEGEKKKNKKTKKKKKKKNENSTSQENGLPTSQGDFDDKPEPTPTAAVQLTGDIIEFPDLISRYIYNLYECQFFFTSLPHGDNLDIGSSQMKEVDSYTVKFNYKYSNMRFEKFGNDFTSIEPASFLYSGDATGDPYITFQPYIIDNSLYNLAEISPDSTGEATTDGTITTQPKYYVLEAVKKHSNEVVPIPSSANISSIEGQEKKEKKDNIFAKPLAGLANDLQTFARTNINKAILTQAALLNKTLENIRSAIPFAGRISAPTNVYEQNDLENSAINLARNFVGRSIRSFFQRP